MTPEERDLITGLFSRLKAADTPNKDREAEELIRKSAADFPAAPYLLAQTVLVQEQALKSAESHIANLEQQLAEAKRALQQSQPSSGGFLSRVRRPWDTPTSSPLPTFAPQPTTAPQPAYASPLSGGGGFLHSALSTAAGVAGGALLFSGIERLLGNNPGPFGGVGSFGTGVSPWGAGTPSENVTVNNYYSDDARDGQTVSDNQDVSDSDAQYTDASYDDNSGQLGDDGDSFDI